ncbi:unnamed protein product [Lactuca virosa]|uniref:Uncharacterized protein n=1 Tax=Lactuca virosa TaxID=75947 RepID=A0AAU9PWA8_9ASTR|nr:unnamed protein product [Lactuca virosa]
MAVQRQTAASRSAMPERREQHGVSDGFPMTMGRRLLSKLAHTPNFRVSIGQVALGGVEGVGGFEGVEGVGGVEGFVGVGGVEGFVGVGGFEGVGGVEGFEGVGGVEGFVGVGGFEGVGGFGGDVQWHPGDVGGFGGGGQSFAVLVEDTRVKKRRLIVRRKVVVAKALEAIFNGFASYSWKV